MFSTEIASLYVCVRVHVCLLQAIDTMHTARFVVLMMDDTKYKLAQLLNKPGDKAMYTYDFGDRWAG